MQEYSPSPPIAGRPVEERITIRLSRDVVERFRATGEGWQTRIDAALRDYLKAHPRLR